MKSPEVVVKIDDDSTTSRKLLNSSNVESNRKSPNTGEGSEEFFFNSVAGTNSIQTEDDADTMEKEVRQGRTGLAETFPHAARLPPLPPDYQSRQTNNNSQGMSPVSRSNSLFNETSSREIRVSFKESSTMTKRRRSTAYNDLGEITSSSSEDMDEEEEDDEGREVDPEDEDEGRIRRGRESMRSRRDNEEVVRCSSNASFERVPTLRRDRTRSRLVDPPPSTESKSGAISGGKSGRISMKSGNIRSGMLNSTGGGGGGDEEEEDPFTEEDVPEEYMKERISGTMIVEWVSLILLVGALICSLIIPVLKDKEVWKLELWKWQVLVIVLICGKLVSGWCIKCIIVLFIERNFMLRKRVLYFVYGLRQAVRNCIWLALVLLAWHLLFDKRVGRAASHVEILDYVTKVLVCFLVSSLIWLLKTLIVKVMASSFHVSAFFDRIQESLFNQFVIKTLSGPPLYDDYQMELRRTRSSDSAALPKSPLIGQSSQISEAVSKVENDQGITLDHIHRLNQKNVSAWNMKRLVKIIRRGALTTLDEQINEDENATQIGSEVEARAAARKIFRNVARPRSRFIYLDDLLRFMQEEEAVKTLSLFEGDTEKDRISKSDLKNWVVYAFRERRALALTLNDTKTAVNKLHHIVNVIVSIIIFLIWLIILNIATSKFLLFVSSQIVLVAFVFGNSCKNVFESIIFLFVVHPYDVGDRCEIDGVQSYLMIKQYSDSKSHPWLSTITSEKMIVEEMNILTTVFLRYDNQKIIYPNFILFTKAVHNFYRSPEMGDAVEFSFHMLTPPEKITQVRQRILSYIEYKKEHWYPNPTIVLKDVESLNTLKIAIWLQHKMNHQDMGERWARRALLIEECVKIFRELDIDYRYLHCNVDVRSLPQPS